VRIARTDPRAVRRETEHSATTILRDERERSLCASTSGSSTGALIADLHRKNGDQL
jgi:hypothetical protein